MLHYLTMTEINRSETEESLDMILHSISLLQINKDDDDFVKEVDKLLVGGMQGQVECKEKVVEFDDIRQNELSRLYLVLTIESRGYVHQ